MSKTTFKTFCVEFYADHVGKTAPEVYAAFKSAPSGISKDEALDRFCKSATAENIANGENGLYEQPALFISGQYLEELAVQGKRDDRRVFVVRRVGHEETWQIAGN